MTNQSFATKLTKSPEAQVVISSSGEPAYLQIPWEVFLSLSEGERETLEILSDPRWSKELPKRIRTYRKNPEKALVNAVSPDQYRAQTA